MNILTLDLIYLDTKKREKERQRDRQTIGQTDRTLLTININNIYWIFCRIERIEQLFSAYGYNVHYGYNVNKENILGTVHRLSCQPDSGSLVCFISSHGDQTSLACPDGDSVQIIDILERANTKQLELCPKVFFFDTCRKYCFYSFNLLFRSSVTTETTNIASVRYLKRQKLKQQNFVGLKT